ncbi:MAG: DMT family transporter [Bacillota bacterium]
MTIPKSASASSSNQELRGALYAVVATLFFASSAAITRMAVGISAAEVAFWRMAGGALLVGALAKINGQPLRISRAQFLRFVIYGAITAAHFWLYISSLGSTSITHSVTLVNTAPLFVTLLSAIWLREPVAPRKLIGIVLAVVGIAILMSFGAVTPQGMVGDLMAVGSALCYAIYSLAGRHERESIPVLSYCFWVYGLAALVLAPLSFSRPHLPYPSVTWLAVGLLALLPTAFGHTLYNAAVRHTRAIYANLISTQEVTGGILLGWLMWGEPLTSQSLLGAAVTVLGIVLVYWL